MSQLYINESLTPQAKKLLYFTKKLRKELSDVHGKIWVWTHHGEVYMRKDGYGYEAVRIDSDKDLDKIRDGDISLDLTK
jgi:hypothetical protein